MKTARITSLSNHKIKTAVEIQKKRGSFKNTAFFLEGPRLIESALASGSTIKQAFFTASFAAGKNSRLLLQKLSGSNVELFEITEPLLGKLSDADTPQGIIALASLNPVLLAELNLQQNPLIVVSDGIQDPGNLGAVIRTADAAGADAVILLPGTCDAFMPKTIRATAGSIFNLPLVYSTIQDLRPWLAEKGIKLIVTTADAGLSLFDADLKGPSALVFGNEARGISSEIRQAADVAIRIPIQGSAESLNVAAASAVFLYEAVRQRSVH